MFFTGTAAIFQILFFPGLIFLELFKPKGRLFFKISVIVTISMLFNATLIYPLVYLHLYTQTTIWILIGLEITAILWLYRRFLKINIDDIGQEICNSISVAVHQIELMFQTDHYSGAVKFFRNLLIVLFSGIAISLIIWFARRLTNNFGSVFNTWDAVVSWNFWAETWGQNTVPFVHLTYPQLLPLNLSLTYLLMGNFELSLFAKAIMPIFALLTVLIIFELAIDQKQYGYLIAVVVMYLLYKKFVGDYITEGYADIPVAFMAMTALVPYMRNENFWEDKKDVVLSFLLAAAAALLKQVGLYILFILPIMGIINGKVKLQKSIWRYFLWFGISILLILPWYLPMGIQVAEDFNRLGLSQYISHSTQVQKSASFIIRTFDAFLGLGKYAALYALLLPALVLVNRRFKYLIVLFLIPFSLLWGAIASYDQRNLTITFASLAIITGLSLETLLEFVFQFLERIKLGKLSSVFLVLLIFLPIGYCGLKLSDEKLLQIWRVEQSQIFSPEIDNQLYSMDRSNPNCKKILTNYPIDFLPGFTGTQVNSYFNDYNVYETLIADPAVCWMLVPSSIDSKVESEIENNLHKGTYQLLFETNKWVPYRLIKIR